MKTINIADDTHDFLLKNVLDFGETPDAVLRRFLKLPPLGGSGASSGTVLAGIPKSALQKLLESSNFTYAKGVVGRFLVVLGWLHDADPAAFTKVFAIKGRGRLYFAKDAETLEESGKSVNPKQIPSTSYWVITTTSTPLKQEILETVMKELGYGLSDIKTATAAIAY